MNKSDSIKLNFSKIANILRPYILGRFLDQLKGVWFIIFYLLGFQYLVLGLPIVYSATIAVGVLIVIVGLMFFMEGLSLGLMPLGEIAGISLPKKAKLWTILVISFALGMLATMAEPAISILKEAGASVDPKSAPLLYSILNDFSSSLVYSVGAGVGVAVLLGMLRFFYSWSLKWFIVPLVVALSLLTIFFHLDPVLNPLIGLAWDCGAVTTGPVTVPLVLAMGMGVCRIAGKGDAGSSGFGVVTLASLMPILAVLMLGYFYYVTDNYYGARGYNTNVTTQSQMPDKAERINVNNQSPKSSEKITDHEFTPGEYAHILKTGKLPNDYEMKFNPEKTELIDGKIIIKDPSFVFTKPKGSISIQSIKIWNGSYNIFTSLVKAMRDALWAIILLSGFLFLVIKFVLKEKLPNADQIGLGLGFAIFGMGIFSLGIAMGLTPLGSQLGANISSSYMSIQPWLLEGFQGPLFSNETLGKFVAVLFAFFLGYGATLAEPALNALGASVEKITVGAFKKSLLMQTVAMGVGLGISLGLFKIIFNVPLTYLLLPPYLILLVLTLLSSEEFVNFGWDSAGVTTGPITVPLVLALGLGVGSNNPDVVSGFGVLSLASVMPVISVLIVGLTVSTPKKENAITE